MRIGIDLRFLRPGQVGGTEMYVRGLLKALKESERAHEFWLFTNAENQRGFEIGAADNFHDTRNWEQSADMDVLFFPGTAIVPLRSGQRQVIVVHDVQHREYPQFFTLRERFRRWRQERPSILRADKVIAISAFTRQALLRFFNVSAERVMVIPSGVEERYYHRFPPEEIEDICKKYQVSRPFLFYPAKNWPHKNHRRLFEAMAILRSRYGQDKSLVLSGEKTREGLPDDIRSIGYIPAADLPFLYQAADALVYPSLYEGFGLPLLEAMASGCAVICSHAGALPEVAGDAAYYFDPFQPEDIARALAAVGTDQALRAELIGKGLLRAREFSWRQTANLILNVLEGVVNEA